MPGAVEQQPLPDELDPAAPVFPAMETSLILDEGQVSNLESRIQRRIADVSSEMGLGTNPQDVSGWMLERERNQNQYDNEWEWRAALGGIFKFSNFSLNLSKRYARLMAAKTTDDLVGSDPFFSFMPTEKGDPELSKQAEWYVQEKFSQSNGKKKLKAAMKSALIRNECVVKLAYVENSTVYYGPGIVAVGPNEYVGPKGLVRIASGDPIVTPKGDYIYQNDDWFPDPTVQGMMRLQKEPNVVVRYQIKFEYKPDLQQILHGEKGLSIRELDYRDFLCPLNAACVHEADINVHLFDMELPQLKARYSGFDVSRSYVNSEYLSGEKQPNITKKEDEMPSSQALQIVNCADVYIRCNPFAGGPGDTGQEYELWVVFDRGHSKVIWYDFLGNHMRKRPFEVIPGIETVQNRWYGVGVFEMLSHKQSYVDTQFNRVNWKSMKASNLRFRNKNAVEQWKAGQKVSFGDDQVLDVIDPRFDKDNPPYYEVASHEIDEYAMKLIELMIQAGSTEVGIVGPDDGAMAGLDTTKLATGIKSLERTGNLLMKFTENDHSDALTEILDQAVDIILEKMDPDELIYREDTGELLALNRDEIRKHQQAVKLHLTRSRSTETIETARMVIQLVREYYEALTPLEQMKLRGEYIRQLKALEVPDAAKLLDEVTPQQVVQWQIAQANAANLPPKTSIATKYDGLERSEQEQVLQKEGIQPASKAEVAAGEKKEVKLEGDKAGAVAKETAKFTPKPNEPGSKSKSG